MKRIFSLMLAVMLLAMSFTSVVFAEGATATMNSGSVLQGESIEVIITLADCPVATGGGIWDVTIPEGLTLTEKTLLLPNPDMKGWDDGGAYFAYDNAADINGQMAKMVLTADADAIGEKIVSCTVQLQGEDFNDYYN